MSAMKTTAALLTLVLVACLSLHAAAEEVAGSWQAQSVSGVEPPEGVALAMSFGEDNIATVTYTVAGQPQSWEYKYTLKDGQVMLDPINAFGEPQTVTYDLRFEEGALHLLSPRPEPVEEEDGEGESTEEDTASEDAGDDAAEGDAEDAEDADAQDTEADVEEEDDRVPVWVLVKA
jgi:hypothetical protein